ncbi:MAG: metallophosphoesterase [Thermodesulfobacteriota bacterium]
MEKTFIIGDVHGCNRLLERLIERIKWDPENHRLIFLGDYIDRGKDPKAVIELIVGLRERSGAVYGNKLTCLELPGREFVSVRA